MKIKGPDNIMLSIVNDGICMHTEIDDDHGRTVTVIHEDDLYIRITEDDTVFCSSVDGEERELNLTYAEARKLLEALPLILHTMETCDA